MRAGRDPNDPAVEIAFVREPFTAFVEERHEPLRNVAEADEREVHARLRHRHSLWHTGARVLWYGCLCAFDGDCYPVRADS
jgi:hypothetical protein